MRGLISANRHATNVGALILAGLNMWLAWAAYGSAQAPDSRIDRSPTSIFPADDYASFADMARRAETLTRQLETVVWEQDRRTLYRELANIRRQQINTTPFDGTLWRHLSFAQSYTGSPITQRAWVIERAKRLSQWNDRERALLTHHCVTEYQAFTQVAKELCRDLIQNLPYHLNIHAVAARVGVDHQVLLSVLDAEGFDLAQLAQ